MNTRQPGGRSRSPRTGGWEQVAISGGGPDRVIVPESASPGDYLLCTANALDEACALLTLTG